MTAEIEIAFTVNGIPRVVRVEPRRTLADVLRNDLELTGTKLGCEHGVCGACAVLLDGEPIRSCLLFAAQIPGRAVTTVEGIAAPDGELHPVQEGFWESTSFQCGFCAAGFTVVGAALVDRGGEPTDEEIRHVLSGNLCRCTGYASIVEGVRAGLRIAAERADA